MSRLRHPIRAIREPFGKAGLTVAILALVMALVGGAYAAGGLTKSQEKQVTKIAKKYAGKPGAPGEKGATGEKGANGTNGSNGAPGVPGESVTASTAGGECTAGGTKFKVGATESHVCNGANGSNASFEYLFNTSTAGSDPGSGKLALDNASPGSATSVQISETDHEATGIAAAIKGWVSGPGAVGTLMIRKVASQSTYAQYSITANEDAGAFDELTVKFLAGNGSFANGDPVTVQYYAGASSTLPPAPPRPASSSTSSMETPSKKSTSRRKSPSRFPSSPMCPL